MSFINTAIDYLRSAKNELTKVTWPSRQDTIRYSALVIGISVGVAVFFGALDIGLSNIVTSALANKKIEQTQAPQTQTPVTPTVEQTVPQVAATGTQTQTIDLKGATPIVTPTDKTDNKK